MKKVKEKEIWGPWFICLGNLERSGERAPNRKINHGPLSSPIFAIFPTLFIFYFGKASEWPKYKMKKWLIANMGPGPLTVF